MRFYEMYFVRNDEIKMLNQWYRHDDYGGDNCTITVHDLYQYTLSLFLSQKDNDKIYVSAKPVQISWCT